MMKLDETRNQVVIGKWEKDISAGGCHLNEKDKEPVNVIIQVILENMVYESQIPYHLQGGRCQGC